MVVFIADVHIRPDHPDDSAKFLQWLKYMEREAHCIYILGDLFNYWFSGMEDQQMDIIQALKNEKVRIIPGNRDFLMANMHEPGLTVLDEEVVISSPSSETILLAHGHTLTKGDYGFKALHALGWPLLRALDRLLPGYLKSRFAPLLVRSSAVIRAPHVAIHTDIARRKGVDRVICGHLHRMYMSGNLIVLPPFYDTGKWVAWDGKGIRVEQGFP